MQLIEEEGNDDMNEVHNTISITYCLTPIAENTLSHTGRKKTEDRRKLLQTQSSNLVQDINLKNANDDILPFEFLSKKKAKILKKAAQPTFWQGFASLFSGKKKRFNKMGPKKNKIVTVIDMLENLFVKYDPDLVELLW